MDRAQFYTQFTAWFEPARILALARQTGWCLRQGKIQADEFLVGLVFGQLSSLGLSLSAHASCFSQPVKREAVCQRFNQPAVEFFRGSFQQGLQRSLEQSPAPALTAALAEHFQAIHLVDSTSFDCPESLAQIYAGCGGGASPANCKVLLRYEYLRGQFEPLALVPGKRSDQGLAETLPPVLQAQELLLMDKGFLKLAVLQQIQDQGAYFLMPLARSLTLGLASGQNGRVALNLAEELRHSPQAMRAWSQVYLGQAPNALAVRVVAFRLSPESAARHRAALCEAQRKQGRQPTAEALEWAGWLILITNAPVDKLPSEVMSYLYRVRWQIELVFKQCKSVLRLDLTQARINPFRIQCEIWARLLAAVVIFAWHSHLQAASGAECQREISFAQVARQIQQHGMALALALIEGGKCLRERLWRLWRHLLYTTIKGRQRTRKTTWELLNEHWLNPAQT
jgi:hypothetical protein